MSSPYTLHGQVLRGLSTLSDPSKVVLAFSNRTWTSAALLEAIASVRQGITSHLRRGEKISTPTVAICMQPSDHLVITLLGVLSAGAAYVPILPSVPHMRCAAMLQNSEACCVVTDDGVDLYEPLRGVEGIALLTYHQLVRSKCDSGIESAVKACGTSTAMIMYTSGSTGVPKAVVISHAAALNFTTTAWELFGPRGPVGCMKTVISFVDHVSEVYPPLMNGGTLLVMPSIASHDLKIFFDEMVSWGVTCLVVVPSFLRALLSYLKTFPSIRPQLKLHHVDTSGESLPLDLGMAFFDVFPNATLANAYGATETVCDSHYILFRGKEHIMTTSRYGDRTTMGSPCPAYTAFVLNDRNDEQQRPDGTPGEIFVSGPISDGYLSAEMTAERFLSHNHLSGGAVMYRLGDIVVRDPDGLFFCLGRIDSQIKIRGQRVDLAEIRAAVLKVSNIESAVMGVADAGELTQQVVTFYVGTAQPNEVKAGIRALLPPYMVPIVSQVDSIPLLDNGKVDTVGLVRQWKAMRKESVVTLPASDVRQRHIAKCVGEVLSLPESQVDLALSFFDLGGSSISVVTLLGLLRGGDGIDTLRTLSLADLLAVRTLDDIGKSNRTVSGFAVVEERYRLTLLRDHVNIKACLEHVLVNFYAKDPLKSLWPEFLESDFREACSKMFGPYSTSDFSIVAEDKATGNIAGVLLSAYLADEVEPIITEANKRVFYLLNLAEEPVREKMCARHGAENIVHPFMVATDLSLSHEDSILLATALEARHLELAQKAGAQGAFALNSHPATQAIAELLGYTEPIMTLVAEVRDPETSQPMFPSAPKDLKIVSYSISF